MVYIVGIIGFIGGFCAGQLLLMFMLRHKSNSDLLGDKSLRVYGLLNWLMAGLGASAGITLYHHYFTP